MAAAAAAWRGAAAFFTSHRGHAYASTALMDPMTKAFVADIHYFIGACGAVRLRQAGLLMQAYAQVMAQQRDDPESHLGALATGALSAVTPGQSLLPISMSLQAVANAFVMLGAAA